MATSVILAHPLPASYAASIGLTNREYLVGEVVSVADAIARSLMSAGYARSQTGGGRVPTAAIRSIADYGATGNGVTDDSAAIQAALTEAKLSGGSVFIPAATFLVGTPIVVPPDVLLFGTGWGSVFKAKAGLNGYVLTTDPALVNGNRLLLRDFEIDGNNGAQTAGGCIRVYNPVQGLFDALHLHHAYDAALHLWGQQGAGPFGHHNRVTNCLFDNSGGSGGAGSGLRIQAADENFIEHCDFESNGGLGANNYHAYDMSGINKFTDCVFVGGREGIRIDGSSTKVRGCTFDGVGGDAIHVNGTGAVIQGNVFSGAAGATNTWRHVVLDNGGYNVVGGNQFWSGPTAQVIRSYLSIFASAGNDAITGNTFRTQGAVGSGGLVDYNGSTAAAIGVLVRSNVGLPDAG